MFRQAKFMTDEKGPRDRALKDYYQMVESAITEKVREDAKRYPRPIGHNRNSPVTLWLSCADADEILDEAGLENPLFFDEDEFEDE